MRKARGELAWGNRIALENLDHSFHHGRRAKRRASGEELIKNRAQAVHVGSGPDRVAVAGRLLGRHVTGRAQNRPGGRQRALFRNPPGQTEIGDLGLAVAVDQDVRGLQIAVKEALAVSVMHGRRDLRHETCRGPGIAGISGKLLSEIAPVHELHAEVRVCPRARQPRRSARCWGGRARPRA